MKLCPGVGIDLSSFTQSYFQKLFLFYVTDFTPVPITAAAEVQTEETQSADQETPCEKTRSDPTEALEKSLQEREAIIKLLQVTIMQQ